METNNGKGLSAQQTTQSSHFSSTLKEATIKEATLNETTLRELERLLATLKFGSITLVVQDSKVVQIEKNEKFRF